ncbi:MAG: CdvA-like protein [Sulfolobales archaeon]|nr:CdvA-like protein [Sulfolobales archaeon]MCX8209267.1 CdvA-like protein [Sulfolobales archaeon]MDW8011098.1 CdvA-like protein [Sulfolobales archaeon]
MATLDQVEKFLGQVVRDEYGRSLGKLIAVFADVSGSVEAVEIAINDYELVKVEASRIMRAPDALIVLPEWKVMAIDVENRLDRVKRRIRSLEELNRKGMIPTHAYEDMRKRLEAEFKKIKEESAKLKDLLKRKMGELDDQILRYERAISNVYVLYMSNEISEQSYKASMDFMRNAKSKCLDEKKDVEKHLELLSKLEAESVEPQVKTVTPQPQTPVQSQAPIPVVIVEESQH